MKVIASNKKAAHDYFIIEKYECGIVLTGTEIKSVRLGKVAIKDAYAKIKNYELFVINMHIAKYDKGNIFNHEEKRDRKLLMQKHDIIRLEQKLKTQGLTLVPTRVYLKENLCKIELALCKGKKLYDKRETAKEEDSARRMEKTVRDYQA
ncbi:MAG TPA: SsrA-binding protein SmpB [Bacillota bacterium]|nr:SsrA-binding protein SmpB [Bacillota bacterium]HPF42257.1 SsrA-binding protein SmpB [Bacillota bacterium]HPJ85720.1 SsrA-binding protein SmpB [Bacillota bacterium]HPQ61643.1 SsrA-binding protein SmpB [Bacillota bacterium]